jgi:hypothetical protein
MKWGVTVRNSGQKAAKTGLKRRQSPDRMSDQGCLKRRQSIAPSGQAVHLFCAKKVQQGLPVMCGMNRASKARNLGFCLVLDALGSRTIARKLQRYVA